MKTKSTIIFAIVLLLVGLVSFVGIFGVSVGNFTINPFSEDIEKGLDLQGGVYVVLEAQTDLKGTELSKRMNEAKLIIEQRVNGLGVSEPNITIENTNRIRVELAGLKDPQQAIDLIGKTALLQFIDADGNVVVTGSNVKNAEAAYDKDSKPCVSLQFDAEGTKLFREKTQQLMDAYSKDRSIDRTIKIVLDGQVKSQPRVITVISDGGASITGSENIEEAMNLAMVIRAGALPVELKEMEVSAIGPTLGLQSFDKSVQAAGIGILLIFLFMILIYKIPGFIACIALTIYILFDIMVMIGLHAKLTLPGIAGLILSIGMAVDANVIIFERIKEELLTGKTARVSVKSGFKRALTTIIDSNATTLIVAIVLLKFGTGLIRGFAVTLLIGLVISVITAVFITRGLLNLVISMGIAKKGKSFGVNKFSEKTFTFNIIGKSKIFIASSLIVIIAGLGVIGFAGLNQGIDFTGGTLLQIDLGKQVSVDQLREITDTIDKDASIVHTGDEKTEVIIRTSSSLDNKERLAFYKLFQDKYNLADDKLIYQEGFQPSIGTETQIKALISVLIAIGCMLVYISFRFKFNFGLAAIVALLHDVLIGLAVYALFRIPINSSFIAAMLTIVGYSINDTIVVFDRIRENIRLMRKAEFKEIVNTSVNQTMIRSINTSITTLLAIVTLYILGVDAIKQFALPLVIGVIAGTYSSVFIASPIWYYFTSRKSKVNYFNPNKLK